MTAPLTGAWLGVTLLQVIAWIGACVVGAGGGRMPPRIRRLALLSGALLGTAAAVAAAILGVLLAGVDWSFGAEKVLVAAPIGVLSSGLALAATWYSLRSERAASPPPRWPFGVLVSAVLGGLVAVLAVLVVGSEVGWPAVAAAIAVWLSGSTVAVLATLRRPIRLQVAVAAVAALCLGLLTLVTVFGPTTGSAASGHHLVESVDDGPTVSVADLRETATGTEVRRFELEARHETITLPGGASYDAIGFGSVPGPIIGVTQGELIEVTLRNRDVEGGVTLHWHGYDVPAGDDGVAGVSQDAVPPGGSFVYRFLADQAGTFWYHTHQTPLDGIRRGLYGTLVVLPPGGIGESTDVVAPIHSMGGSTLVGADAVLRVPETDGAVRLRLANTDQAPRRLVLDDDAEILALDGDELADPAPLPAGTVLRIPAGGRADLRLPDGATVAVAIEGDRDAGILIGDAGEEVPRLSFAGPEFDVLDAASGAQPDWARGPADVRAEQVLDRLVRVVGGLPRLADTINGAAFPFVDPIVVGQGEVVEVTIVNRGTETHPMHLHGHRMLVLERDGVVLDEALRLDTLDVRPGEVWRIRFVADNPGLWMDHCHNLEHAVSGMVMHVAYEGVASPFDLGGDHGNAPE